MEQKHLIIVDEQSQSATLDAIKNTLKNEGIDLVYKEIKRVATNAIVDMSAWIMGSTGLVVSVSDDNKEFREVAVKDIPAETNIDKKGVENYEITFDPVKARYVKVVIKRSPALPKGHAGEGKAAYMFIDEIEVD
mgnify:CR=1 FL=1